MDPQLYNLRRKVEHYQEVLQTTLNNRQVWQDELRETIVEKLKALTKEVGLEASVDVRKDLENLEGVVLSLGDVKSGLSQRLNDTLKRDLIKHNGSLIYQQLFNRKVIVLINYPHIENYGEPREPKTLSIYRPEELQAPFFIRHLDAFIQEITNWEDFDDEEPMKRIGFNMGINPNEPAAE